MGRVGTKAVVPEARAVEGIVCPPHPVHILMTVEPAWPRHQLIRQSPILVSLCREVGDMLPKVPYNFIGKEAMTGEGSCAASRPASNKSWLCLVLMGTHVHLRVGDFLSAE